MDALDIFAGRFNTTHTGRYFERLPDTVASPTTVKELYALEEGRDFDYEIVNPEERQYKMLISNLSDSDGATETIKSLYCLPWKNKAFVLTDDGVLYSIISIIKDTSSAENEAARFMPVPVGTEYILRLIEIENPWEIG